MNNRVLQFLAKAKDISLTGDELGALLQQVSTFIQEHPIDTSLEDFSAQTTEVHLSKKEKMQSLLQLTEFMTKHPPVVPQPVSHLKGFGVSLPWRLPALAMSAILLATAGGTLAWAAEGALPDEPLYPIKIHVTERIRGWTHRSLDRKAAWETQKLERRILEAEELTYLKEIPKSMITKIEQKIENHLGNVEEHLANLPKEQRKKKEEQLMQFLKNHERSLTILHKGKPQQILPIIRAVQKQHMKMERVQREEKSESSSSHISLQSKQPQWLPVLERVESQRNRGSSGIILENNGIPHPFKEKDRNDLLKEEKIR